MAFHRRNSGYAIGIERSVQQVYPENSWDQQSKVKGHNLEVRPKGPRIHHGGQGQHQDRLSAHSLLGPWCLYIRSDGKSFQKQYLSRNKTQSHNLMNEQFPYQNASKILGLCRTKVGTFHQVQEMTSVCTHCVGCKRLFRPY